MTYTLVWDHMANAPSADIIQRDADGAFIPMDADNIDCQDYLAWLDEGGVPAECSTPASTLPETAPVEDRVADLENRVDQLESGSG